MFVTEEVTVPVRLEDATARLTHLINWRTLHHACHDAYDQGLSALTRVGPAPEFSKLVRVRFGEPARRGTVVTVPMRWEATGTTGGLFPVLDADLLLSGYGPDQTRLRLTGSYRPPFGRTGQALDHAVLHHLANASVRFLVSDMAVRLADPSPEQYPETSTARFRPFPAPGTT